MKLVPNGWHIQEFYGGFNGTCTQTAAAMALASALQQPRTHDDVVNLMLSMTRAMQQAGTAAANGATTIFNMARELERNGATILVEEDWNGGTAPNWQSILHEHAGENPIVLQIAAAHNIMDTAGNAQNSGVDYHAIAVMGINDDGTYIVYDGNNSFVEVAGDSYSEQTLADAQPCGLLVLKTTIGVNPMIPDNWHDDGEKLTCGGTNCIVRGGFREEILKGGWNAQDIPINNEVDFTDVVRQRFTGAVLYYNKKDGGIWRGDVHAELLGRTKEALEKGVNF